MDGGRRRFRGRLGGITREEAAQGTVEYAVTVIAVLSIVLACGALWRAGRDGVLARLVEQAAPRALSGFGGLDIALF